MLLLMVMILLLVDGGGGEVAGCAAAVAMVSVPANVPTRDVHTLCTGMFLPTGMFCGVDVIYRRSQLLGRRGRHQLRGGFESGGVG